MSPTNHYEPQETSQGDGWPARGCSRDRLADIQDPSGVRKGTVKVPACDAQQC